MSRTGASTGPDGMGRLRVTCERHAGDWSWLAPLPEVVEHVCRAMADVPPAATRPSLHQAIPIQVDLALSDDVEVRALNRQWRGLDKPTNVLSFPSPDVPHASEGLRFLGDIVLAEGTLLAEAEAAGISPQDHFRHLLVHGMLHLLGYDHEDDREAEAMEALETRILGVLGVADPYAGTLPEPKLR